ncbi:circumsporozoite protein-like [Etheostoma spectabile]|uniref:circumsporozoite protein-like n=1 Tax=Etheostoma spectabile TaxID=54343 RepID=UPI0013AFD5D6|nr:circumsporozoite protein-like [Etheostoma spectabile]
MIRDVSPNDLSMKRAFALLQSMESKLIQAAKEAQLETNEVEAEAAIQKLADVQLPLNGPKRLETNQTLGDQAANQTLGDQAANQTLGDQAANQTLGDQAANQTLGDQAANQTLGDQAANQTLGDQAANQTMLIGRISSSRANPQQGLEQGSGRSHHASQSSPGNHTD